MNIASGVYELIMLYIIIFVGLVLRKKGIFTEGVIKGVNSMVFLAVWPAMIIMTTQKEYDQPQLAGFLFTFSFALVFLAAMALIVHWVVKNRLSAQQASVFTLLVTMPNAGFVGYPIIEAVYGAEGVIYLSAFLMAFNMVLWTIGVMIFGGGKKNFFKNLLNPGLIASVLGMLLFFFRIQLPRPLLSAVQRVGNMVTPLSMLLLGARLDGLRREDIRCGLTWLAAGLKLVAVPLIAFVILKLIGVSGILPGVIILSICMPSASAAQIFSEKFHKDVALSTKGITLSMLVCFAVIPVFMFLANL